MDNIFNLRKFLVKLKCQLDSILSRLDKIENDCCGGGGGGTGYEYFGSGSIVIGPDRIVKLQPSLLYNIQLGVNASSWIEDNENFLAYKTDLTTLENQIQQWVNQQGFKTIDTTYNIFTSIQDGLVPMSGIGGDTKFLRGDGVWVEMDEDCCNWEEKDW